MAEPRPRNWKAMRADRVLAMAEIRFGTRFASKDAAIAELSKLPAAEQRRMSKTAVSKSQTARGLDASKPQMIAGMSKPNRFHVPALSPEPGAKPTERIKQAREVAAWRLKGAKEMRAGGNPRADSIEKMGRAAESRAIGMEMQIASRVAKGQSTRAAKETAKMSTNLRAALERGTEASAAQANASGPFKNIHGPGGRYKDSPAIKQIAADYKAGKISLATADARRRALRADGLHVVRTDVATEVSKRGKAPPAPKSNPAVVEALAAKFKTATALDDAAKAKLSAVLHEFKTAKLSRADSHALAKSLGVPASASASRAEVRKSVELGLKQSVLDSSRLGLASRLSRVKADTASSAAPPAKAAKTTKAPRAAKSNPAVVEALAGKVKSALEGGSRDAITAVQSELAAAKLSKADMHALAQATGTPIAPSASGKAAVGRVTQRLSSMAGFLAKKAAVGGRSAASILLPIAAVAAASSAFSDSSHAAEARGEERTAARAKGSAEAAKAVTDLISFGAAGEVERARAEGAGMGEALARGATKGAINFATFGVAEMANDALADKGGVAGAITGTVTQASAKLGAMLGWSDAARAASAAARAQPMAFLNAAAERKASVPPKPAAPAFAVVAGAQRRPDGETEGYTRRGRNGQAVQVKAYRTPTR